MAASSVRAVTSSSAQLPPVMALPSSGFSFSGSGSDAACEAAALLAAAEEAAASAREALSASKSRSLTTVYHVWVAQSSTWGAANHAAASTAATSTTMPMPRFTRVSRL